jgi:hypothetical protein
VPERIALVIVVTEDARSGAVLRRYLGRAVDSRQIRLRIAPKGQQSAYDWVIEQYPTEVSEHRHRVSAKGRNNAALVVHIDADTSPVDQRLKQLARALKSARAKPRGNTERIAIVVPKRNTETWLHGLCGVVVDETYDFKEDPDARIASNERRRNRLCDQRLGPAAAELYRLTRSNAPEPPVGLPALGVAVQELRRLEL